MKHKSHGEFTVDECEDNTKYKFRIGESVASSLSGFIAGLLVGAIILMAVLYFIRPFFEH